MIKQVFLECYTSVSLSCSYTQRIRMHAASRTDPRDDPDLISWYLQIVLDLELSLHIIILIPHFKKKKTEKEQSPFLNLWKNVSM